MNDSQISVIEKCAHGSHRGTMKFPEVVGSLIGISVERYHADYSRSETTYYLPSGDSHIVKLEHEAMPIADLFAADQVEAAIRASQRGEIAYVEFVRRTKNAGCVGYFVQIAGRRAIYFGRNGESHLEPFPPS